MPAAKIPTNEAQRVAALEDLGVLDTPPEQRFDRLTRIAAHLLDVPIALISLVDTNRQWFKSHYGLDVCETPRSESFCAHALGSHQPFTIADATRDPRFADNPLVIGPPGIRFYMGIPLRGPGDHILGTLCVIDTQPREVSPAETQILQDLAEVVEDELSRRELRAVSLQLQQSNQKLESVIEASPEAIITCDMQQRIDVWSPSAEALFGQSPEVAVGRLLAEINSGLSDKLSELSQRTARGESIRDEHVDFTLSDGTLKHLDVSVAPLAGESGEQTGFMTIIADITDRTRLLQQTESEHQLLEAVMNNVDAGVAACDEQGNLTVFNRTAREYIGELVSLPADQLAEHYQIYEPDGQTLLAVKRFPLYQALMGKEVKNMEFLVRPIGKPERVLLANGSAYGAPGSKQRGAVVVVHDITLRKALERDLEYQATHDTLTGLPNRSALMEILSGAIARATRSGEASAVMFLDLDAFKTINDTHGHQVGDQVLQQFAARINAVLRESDTLARLSGDEFVIIAEQLKDGEADARLIADKILQAIATPLPLVGGLTVKTSIGIALHRGQCTADALMNQADAAMYRVKKQNGDRVFIDARRIQ